MKKFVILIIILAGLASGSIAQNVGLSFSYFVPRNGYFSTPISPFSLRGVGVNFNKYFGVQTGATLYRMAGLNIIDLPFESKDPMLGPNFTVFVPAELYFQLKGRSLQFNIKGGGFFFYGFAQKLNSGNIDRAIRKYKNWDVANSDLSFQNNPGFGTHVGAEMTFYFTQFGISLEANYLMGAAKLPLSGTYTGGTLATTTQSATLQKVTADFKDAKVDFTGFEFSIGIILTGKGSAQKPRSGRRR